MGPFRTVFLTGGTRLRAGNGGIGASCKKVSNTGWEPQKGLVISLGCESGSPYRTRGSRDLVSDLPSLFKEFLSSQELGFPLLCSDCTKSYTLQMLAFLTSLFQVLSSSVHYLPGILSPHTLLKTPKPNDGEEKREGDCPFDRAQG